MYKILSFLAKLIAFRRTIGYTLVSNTALRPQKAHWDDAGIDIFADESVVIPAGKVRKIKTGLAFQLPVGTFGQICDRSSMGSKGIHVFGGVIDSSYTGEVIVCLYNSTDQDFTIKYADKIAQVVVQKIHLAKLVKKNCLNVTERGAKGFGSSGA